MGAILTVLDKGNFSLNLGFMQLGGELSEFDRQCAWELYTELSTRVAVSGKINRDVDDFSGEILIESLSSLYSFFQEARNIMKRFPVGKISMDDEDNHLGVLVNRILSDVLRPFLEKWQSNFRHWWEEESNPRVSPMERQASFPEYDDFIADWGSVRYLMRQVRDEIAKQYKLINIQ